MAQRHAIEAAVPKDPGPELEALHRELGAIERDRQDLARGRGRYAEKPVDEAARALVAVAAVSTPK